MSMNSKCFLCGNLMCNLQLTTTADDVQLLQDWKRNWAASLCGILGLDQENYISVFQSASYCTCCQESICTVDFTLSTIERFQSNLSTLRSDIVERLDHHYVKMNPEQHDPLGVTDSNSIENIIQAIQNVKPESESDADSVSRGDEFCDVHVSHHPYVRQQRLVKLKRRLPLAHVQVSSVSSVLIRRSSRRKKNQKLTESDHTEHVAVQSTPPAKSNKTNLSTIRISFPNDNEKTCSPNKVSRSGRVIKPVRRLEEISGNDDNDVTDEGDSEFEHDSELLATDDAGPDLSNAKGTKRRVPSKTEMRQRNRKKRIVEITNDDDTAEKFPCPVCKKAFPSESKMEVHLRRAHRLKESNSFKCSICCKLFRSASKCQEHQKLHQEDTPFTCILCQKPHTSEVELIHHVQMEHDRKSDWCNFAECLQAHVAFTNQKEMKNHLATHHRLEEKELGMSYHCTRCELRFKARNTLETHLVKVHQILEGDVLPCPICSKVFVGKVRLRIHHENVHTALKRNPKCSICKKSFPSTQTVSEHEFLHCSSHLGPFDCVLCEEKPKNSSELRMHVLRTHEILPFKCLDCDALGFETASKLKQHQYESHYPIELTKSCDQCPFKTRKLGKLKEHMLSHGERTFICTMQNCDARFYSAQRRDAHVRHTHPDDRKPLFRCKLCPKTFRTKSQLSSHETYHSDLRSFLCEVCSATFKTPNTLQHHMRVHDPNKKTGNNWKLQRPRKPRLSKSSAIVKEMTVVEAEVPNAVSDGAQKITDTLVCPPIGATHTGTDIPQREKVIALPSFPEITSSAPTDWF